MFNSIIMGSIIMNNNIMSIMNNIIMSIMKHNEQQYKGMHKVFTST